MDKTKIENLDKAVMEALNDYKEDVIVKMKDQIAKANRNALRMVKNKSPRKTGSYQKGWTSKKMYEDKQALRYWIHNKTDWQLTHLLEYGHIKWLWGVDMSPETVKPVPHIEPTARWIQTELPKGVKDRIR